MNAKYSIPQYIIIATLVAVAVLVLPTACHDELGYPSFEGQRITFKLTAPDTWHKGMSVNESAPTTHCTSVRALSGGDTKLYLHTVVADNPVKEKTTVTRGTPVKDTEAFQEAYPRFSLSGICYTGEYPKEESDNPWTTEYAYNLYYDSKTGMAEEAEGGKLLWPSNGNVRFFAFAPTVEDFTELKTGGTLALSNADHKGSPTLTYTVPSDVTKQVDLMTVCADISAATTPQVELKFGHALTAVQIKCGKDMLAGKITGVTIAGIHGKGTQVIGADTWTPSDEEDKATYTISKGITLSPGKDSTDQIHVPEGTPITGTDTTENLTFMLLPQTLPAGATMTIEFTDAATQTPRTLKGSIAGHKWEAGKIVTYTVSPSSINISSKFKFSKKGATTENPTGDTIPYSGVWYDATYSAKVEITQEGVAPKTIDIPAEKVKLQYSIDNSDWKDCTKDGNGLLVIAAQNAYTEMNSKFVNKESEVGSKDSPFSLSGEYGETANCYLVDQAGYYSLSLVYGNGNVSLPTGNTDGFKYFPKHDDATIPADGKISKSDAHDAVLCWQDAPDLIDPASVEVKDGNLVFHIRKHTLAQGNALLAVRNASKQIIWSWHIWVTPHKSDFYNESKHYHSQTYNDKTLLGEYYFAQYNLGWCDNHVHNVSRPFRLQAVIDMSAYGGNNTTTVDIPGTFTQMEFKGSDAGDNTYYQWGRKDPMLGGIYNANTPKYEYKKRGSSSLQDRDTNEFTMENKQVFNQYHEDTCNYSFCKNLGDGIAINDYTSNGVTIGYSIQHPYMFITNSRCNDGGDTPTPAFNYRNHWHKPYAESPVGYLNAGTHIMFNAWDAGATNAGYAYDIVFTDPNNIKAGRLEEYLKSNAADVKKSVYDPCPPKFKVPPIDAFRGIAQAKPSNNGDYGLGYKTLSDNAWTITYNGQTIKFPLTGVRDYALRNNEWGTVTVANPREFYKISMPAFKMLSFVSSATIVKKEDYNAYQLLILAIDKDRKQPSSDTNIKISCYTTSSNSYGLPVRPIRDIPNKK